MVSKKDSRMAWGVTLLFFGCLFLLRQIHIFPDQLEQYIFDFKNYPLFMGVIFLIFNSNKTPEYCFENCSTKTCFMGCNLKQVNSKQV